MGINYFEYHGKNRVTCNAKKKKQYGSCCGNCQYMHYPNDPLAGQILMNLATTQTAMISLGVY